MTGHQAVRRLMAFAAGKPLPHGETLCVPKPGRTLVPDDALVVAFVRMGGESSPWGVAFGHPGRKPDVLMVPEARTRDYVADMMAEFAPVLLRHVLHRGSTTPARSRSSAESGQSYHCGRYGFRTGRT